jgi:hypothetical protein
MTLRFPSTHTLGTWEMVLPKARIASARASRSSKILFGGGHMLLKYFQARLDHVCLEECLVLGRL